MKVIGLKGISHLLRNLYLISRIKDEKPLGILLVAPPGAGKSFALVTIKYPNLILVSDMTPRGLQDIILECRQINNKHGKNGGKHTGYVVIPELEKILSRQNSTATFTSLANILLEEGARYLRRYDINIKFDKPLNFGLISALTPDTFNRRQEYLEGKGFLSRHLILGFDYCNSDKIAIEDFILRSAKPDIIAVEDTPTKNVVIPEHLLGTLQKLSSRLAVLRKDKFKFRAIIQLRALLKAEALANHRTEVTIKDCQNLYCLLPFFLSGNILSQSSNRLDRQATDADYCFLKQFILGEKWFGNGQMYNEDTRKWASDRLLRMKLLSWKNGCFKLGKELY